MQVRDEIRRYSDEKDKPILYWLLNRYHMQSQWGFVAKCSFSPEPYPKNHRIWAPTEEGRILFNALN